MRAMRRVLPVLVVWLVGCGGDDLRRRPPPEPMAMCGDGIIQTGENCDASALGDATCPSLGFDTGQIICTAACKYDTTLCVKRCGNGVLDLGESCDGTLNVPACTNWGFNACSDSCVVDTRRCLSTSPFETGPELTVDKGGRTVLSDRNLVMVVPAFERIEIFPWNMTRGFEASGSRKLSFLRSPRAHEILDANGDGITDVATVNADGAFDLILGGATSSLVTLDAGSISSGGFLPANGTVRQHAIYLADNAFFALSSAGVTTTSTPSRAAITRGPHGIVWTDAADLHFTDGGTFAVPDLHIGIGTADFDGDGDEDLAAITTMGVRLYENTGTGFAPRVTWAITSSASSVRVLDFDQDGRADVFWVTDEGFVIRRNDGNFGFTPHAITTPTGPRYAPSIGDADGDQDLDVAFTYPGTGEQTTTRLWRNRVR